MDVENILSRVLENVAVEQKYDKPTIKIAAINSGGANYTSALFTATITTPGKDPLNLFAKVAILGEELREKMKVDRLFENEKFTYMKIITFYNDIQNKYDIPQEERLVFPKFYAFDSAKLQETIILENLIAQGYESYSRFKSMDWAYASQAVTVLAKWHALSFAYNQEDPETYQKILKEKMMVMDTLEEDEDSKGGFEKLCQSSVMAVDEKYREKLIQFMQKLSDPQQFLKYYIPLKHTVISHGDYRISNLLSKTKDDGTIDIIPIDFQTIHPGRPTGDLVYFLFTGSDQKFRAQYYKQLIDLYYEQLGLALHRMDMDVEKIYPRKDFEEELEDTLPFGLMVAIVVLPVNLVEEENAPKLEKGIGDFQVKTNEIYSERLTGIMEDLVNLGVV